MICLGEKKPKRVKAVGVCGSECFQQVIAVIGFGLQNRFFLIKNKCTLRGVYVCLKAVI